jgi:hypothetical protein
MPVYIGAIEQPEASFSTNAEQIFILKNGLVGHWPGLRLTIYYYRLIALDYGFVYRVEKKLTAE